MVASVIWKRVCSTLSRRALIRYGRVLDERCCSTNLDALLCWVYLLDSTPVFIGIPEPAKERADDHDRSRTHDVGGGRGPRACLATHRPSWSAPAGPPH